jgi:2-polyprenyl-3-methyl-5-hydroxy-6-metoxy-1,4-benzoquinol methylase
MVRSLPQATRRVDAPHAPLPPLTDPLLVAEWLSDITGQPVERVRQRLQAECRRLGHNVCEAAREFGLVPHVWNERLLEFYGQTDAFLYETAVWNSTRIKAALRDTVVEVLETHLSAGARVLCFGDGMGFDSAALAERGFVVTCHDVSGPGLEFARRIFEWNRLPVQIVTQEADLAADSFEAIVCLDVLEHVPDPPAVVRRFASWLREDGLLAVHAPFFHVDSTRPTHLDSNRQYAGRIRSLYGPAGFGALVHCGPLLNPVVLRKSPAAEALPLSMLQRLRLAGRQLLLHAASRVPYVPGAVVAGLCRPSAAWTRTLSAVVGDPPSRS